MENDVSFPLSNGLVHDVQFSSTTDEFAGEQVLLQLSDDRGSSSSHDLFDEVFITDSREGVMCLTLEDTLTTDSSLNLHDVSGHLSLESTSARTVGCFVGSASELSELSDDGVLRVNSLKSCKIVAENNPQFPVHCVDSHEIFSTGNSSQSLGKQTGVDFELKSVKVPTMLVKSLSQQSQQKKRGGWPKGRKRKPEKVLKPPKAPATGYVLYLNERRKLYKNLPFSEVTTLLGHEWTRMSQEEKQVYLDRAEREKKRYKQEFLLYKKSDEYLSYVAAQRLKRIKKNGGTLVGELEPVDEIEDEDSEDLYCQTCDQWFNTLHNKKEHLFGRLHLQNVSQGLNREFSQKNSSDSENRVPHLHSVDADQPNISLELEQKEQELETLRQQVSTLESNNLKHVQDLLELSSRQIQANADWEAVQRKRVELENEMVSLLNLPNLLLKHSPDVVSRQQTNSNIIIVTSDHRNSLDVPCISESLRLPFSKNV